MNERMDDRDVNGGVGVAERVEEALQQLLERTRPPQSCRKRCERVWHDSPQRMTGASNGSAGGGPAPA